MTTKRYAFDVQLLTIGNIFDVQITEAPVDITLKDGFKCY